MAATGKIRIGVLTSSRADFGIYLPLLKALKRDKAFVTEIIAFGTHLSRYHGYTLHDIEKQGFTVKHKISSMLLHDDAGSIASAYALTALKFSDFWSQHVNEFDWVFCLGDRYEMAAAIAAGIPLGIRFAHLHGGETTLGAIDNVYRHSMTLASALHFVSIPPFKTRIRELTGTGKNCHVTGSLSLDNLDDIKFLTKKEFRQTWGIDLDVPSALVTIHPETVAYNKNEVFAREAFKALKTIVEEKQLIISMPNADTSGNIFRKTFQELKQILPDKVFLIENFGTQSYFTCMKEVDYLVGNSSSGIIEAASFKKYVVNIGNRQKGRVSGGNVLHVPFNSAAMVKVCRSIGSMPEWKEKNMYAGQGAAASIINVLKKLHR